MFTFVSIALVGLFLLVVSALFGDHHVDHDVTIETAHEVSFGEHPSPFSLRVISLFATAFGAAGSIAFSAGAGYALSTAAGTYPFEHRFKTMGDRLTGVKWFTEFEDPSGDPLACALNRLHGVFVDADGSVFIGDSEAHRVRVLRRR